MKIGIIIAMDKEFSRVAAMLNDAKKETDGILNYTTGTLSDGKEIIMQHCGMGKVNAAIGATMLIDKYHPDMIISTGVAGGASLSLEVKDVVVSTKVAYHDAWYGMSNKYGQVQGMPLFYESPRKLIECAMGVDADVQVNGGLIVTGDWFVDKKDKMKEILGHFPNALAVDMESASIAQTCRVFNVPFISFRIISDIALKENNTEMYENFWNDIADSSFEVTQKFINAIPAKMKLE